MGNFNSGRWRNGHNPRPVAEDSQRLDSKSFRYPLERAALAGAFSGEITWKRGEIVVATIAYIVYQDNQIWLGFHFKGEPIVQKIEVETLNGRIYFHCPGCDRRVGCLFAPGSKFYCRHCWGITYRSCNDSHKWRGLYKHLGLDGIEAQRFERLFRHKKL